MLTNLDHLPRLDDGDLVALGSSGEAVRDHQGGASLGVEKGGREEM